MKYSTGEAKLNTIAKQYYTQLHARFMGVPLNWNVFWHNNANKCLRNQSL